MKRCFIATVIKVLCRNVVSNKRTIRKVSNQIMPTNLENMVANILEEVGLHTKPKKGDLNKSVQTIVQHS